MSEVETGQRFIEKCLQMSGVVLEWFCIIIINDFDEKRYSEDNGEINNVI